MDPKLLAEIEKTCRDAGLGYATVNNQLYRKHVGALLVAYHSLRNHLVQALKLRAELWGILTPDVGPAPLDNDPSTIDDPNLIKSWDKILVAAAVEVSRTTQVQGDGDVTEGEVQGHTGKEGPIPTNAGQRTP